MSILVRGAEKSRGQGELGWVEEGEGGMEGRGRLWWWLHSGMSRARLSGSPLQRSRGAVLIHQSGSPSASHMHACPLKVLRLARATSAAVCIFVLNCRARALLARQRRGLVAVAVAVAQRPR